MLNGRRLSHRRPVPPGRLSEVARTFSSAQGYLHNVHDMMASRLSLQGEDLAWSSRKQS